MPHDGVNPQPQNTAAKANTLAADSLLQSRSILNQQRRARFWGQHSLLLMGIVLLISTVYAISVRLISTGFERVERAETLLNVQRARHALDARLERLDSVATGWAQWDTALQFVKGVKSPETREFLASDLSDSGMAVLQSDVVIYADHNAKIVYATAYDLKREHKTPLSPALLRILNTPSLLHHRNFRSSITGIVNGPRGPLLVVSLPVLRADGRGDVGGALLLGRTLDASVQAELSRGVELPVTGYGFASNLPPDVEIARAALKAPSEESGMPSPAMPHLVAGARTFSESSQETSEVERVSFVRPLNQQTIAGYAVVRDIGGRPALLLRIVAPRTAYAQERASLLNLLVALVGIGTVAALGLVLMQSRLSTSTALRLEDEARMRSFFQGMGEGMLITDLNDRVQDANQRMEALCGYTLDEMRGRPAYEFLMEREEWPVLNSYNERRAQGHSDVYEMYLRRKDGSKFWSLIHASPLRDARGQVVGTIGAQIDITTRKKTEEDLERSVAALQESENRFRSLIEQAVDAVIVHDARGRLLDANQRLCEALGYTRDELLNMHVGEFEMNLDTEDVAARWTQMVPNEPILVNGVHRRKDGTTFPVEVHVGLVQFDGQQVYLALARDVTERRRIEARLAQSLLERERIMETVPDVIFQLDLEGCLVSWNRRLEILTDYSPAELHHMSALWFFPPDEQPRIGDAIATAYREGSVEVEAQLRIKNDTLLPTSWVAVPLKDEAGRVIGITGTGRDISERLKIERERAEAEARLHAAETRFWSVVQAATDGIIVADGRGNIVSWNDGAQNIFGYDAAEVIGKSVTLLMPERFIEGHQMGVERVSAGAPSQIVGTPIELIGRRCDGSEFPLELNLNLWRDGGETFYASIVRDITVRKANEAQLQASLHEKDVLLKEIHHRVKNNMQVISSLLNRQVRNVTDPQTRELFKDAQNRIKSMALIHERLYQQETLAIVDFAGYLRQLVGQLMRAQRTGNIKLELDLAPLELDIDTAVPCGLIVNELISNAFKHGFADGRRGCLRVALARQEGGATLIVEDDGAGMPTGFDPFATRSLGMRLVADLTDQIKGNLDLTTEPDRGARWTLSMSFFDNVKEVDGTVNLNREDGQNGAYRDTAKSQNTGIQQLVAADVS